MEIEGETLWYGDAKDRAFKNEIADFTQRWLNDEPTMPVHTSGSTGEPKLMYAEKVKMWNSACATIQGFRTAKRQYRLAMYAPPIHCSADDAGARLCRPVANHSCSPHLASLSPFARSPPTLPLSPPMQVYESLQHPHDCSLLRRTLCLIIGGGALNPELEARLRTFPGEVWSTYGMTETLSHIALRRVNGAEPQDAYHPLPGVTVSLSAEGTLVIDAPEVCDERLETNDLAEIQPDGSF